MNSTQSLRIRELEDETTRLQSENISLRRKMIKVHIDGSRVCPREFFTRLETVQLKLNGKMKEFGELMKELGSLQSLAISESEELPSWREEMGLQPVASPAELKPQRNGFILAEPPKNQDGRLPRISERLDRTLTYVGNPCALNAWYMGHDADSAHSEDEILDLIPGIADDFDTNDSPDLGPPPIAHFETDDCAEAEVSEVREQPEEKTQPQPVQYRPGSALARYEDRKRRRESANVFDFRSTENSKGLAASAEPDVSRDHTVSDSEKPLRTAAKRKISVKEDEELSVCEVSDSGATTQSDHEVVKEDKDAKGTDDGEKEPERRVFVPSVRVTQQAVLAYELEDQVAGGPGSMSVIVPSPERPALVPSKICEVESSGH